jgi:hypothetical protein
MVGVQSRLPPAHQRSNRGRALMVTGSSRKPLGDRTYVIDP